MRCTIIPVTCVMRLNSIQCWWSGCWQEGRVSPCKTSCLVVWLSVASSAALVLFPSLFLHSALPPLHDRSRPAHSCFSYSNFSSFTLSAVLGPSDRVVIEWPLVKNQLSALRRLSALKANFFFFHCFRSTKVRCKDILNTFALLIK